jgi:hypothetical protein
MEPELENLVIVFGENCYLPEDFMYDQGKEVLEEKCRRQEIQIQNLQEQLAKIASLLHKVR